MTAAKVVDASALAAVLFAEPAADVVAANLRGASLCAPSLLAYEIASVCLKKLRAHPANAAAILAQFTAWRKIAIELFDADHDRVLQLAQELGLSSYDASYLMLAQKLGVELVTLDRRLARAAATFDRQA